MRHRTKAVQTADWVKLIKSTNPKTGRHHYIVQVDWYTFNRTGPIAGVDATTSKFDQIRDHFDPHHTRGGRWASKWKFRNRTEAEQLIMLAVLKFG